jgi:DNA-binding transcriptional regulator YdaS (Cro superfamily)
MKTIDYINKFNKDERVVELKRIAAALNVSFSYIRHMCNGTRSIPKKYAVAWEKATNGAVTRFDIWPELND